MKTFLLKMLHNNMLLKIADIIKAHSRDETYPFTFDNGEGGIDEIFASNYQPIIKRLIY